MARRSARLQKRSPTPTSSSSNNTQPALSVQPEELPSVFRNTESEMKTPKKPVVKKSKLVSNLPQPTNTPTPHKSKSSTSLFNAFKTRTPKNRTPIKPAGEEMHPALHHPSTAKPLDEARWLGFHALGAQTAPPKASDGYKGGQDTPSKTPVPATTNESSSFLPSPEFRFRFKLPASGLSPTSSHLLNNANEENAVSGRRALFGADEFTTQVDMSPKRKMAVPKSKSSRYSDAHTQQFNRMDSIAHHPSAFRADPNRFKPVNTMLKRSPSKAELDKQEPAMKGTNTPLKRTQSKPEVMQPATKIPPSLKRSQSKMDVTQPNGNPPRGQSTVRLVAPARDGSARTQDGNSPAKRIKRTETDDAASTRPVSEDGGVQTGKATTPGRTLHSRIGFPKPASRASRLMTPTQSSLSRSQSVKAIKSTSTIPSLLPTPSTKTLFSSANIAETMKEGVREGIRKTSNSLQKVKSILRTPNRKFSTDPEKVAAGTHMSPPPGLGLNPGMLLPKVPATAPVRKQVNFTTSTLERAAQEELSNSPSPVKLRVGSEAPTGAIIYPALQPSVEYPVLPDDTDSPSRRLTFGGTGGNTPSKFLFKSDMSIKFGPATAGTIRMVRKSDASALVEGKKRKLDNLEELSDKENARPQDEIRSPKKMKTASVEAPATPSSKLPRQTPKRQGASITKSRLAFLATPKRSKA